MEIKTFRAKTMPQALDLVRRELGPEAMVLHTREVNAGLISRMFFGRSYEIAAANSPRPSIDREPHRVPSNRVSSPGGRSVDFEGDSTNSLVERNAPTAASCDWPLNSDSLQGREASGIEAAPIASRLPQANWSLPVATPHDLDSQITELQSLVQQLRQRTADAPQRDVPPALFELFTDMIEAEVEEEIARDFVDRLRRGSSGYSQEKHDLRRQLVELLQDELRVSGPLRAPTSGGRLVALVGPTGVGKTTTIAKLAANYRLRENRRVGLITVDTYRIAAVEQLRTYAEIIDLPMEVVSTPREMREAVSRMRNFDLVLMDTAGRSPRDEVRIRELRSMLAEAEPHEIHLVLSAAASARSLAAAAEKFAPVGVTSLIVTKLDEATALGNLLSLVRKCQLPFSYLTDGQNVPDDIAVAELRPLAQMILNMDK